MIPVITVDGASGTGKGVVTHLVAKILDWNLFDSGALYRVLALAAINSGTSLDDETAITQLANNLDVQFKTTHAGEFPHILLKGVDVTDDIRTETIGNAASKIGTFPLMRTALLGRQRDFRQKPGLVTDGRDMGTVVFPDAIVKIFLTASPEVRARRRYNQLKQKGVDVNLGSLVDELRERDKRDRERTVAPLKLADDAICVDTDNLTIDQVVERIMSEVKKAL